MERSSLAERFDGKNNSLNFIRLLLAVSVIVYHSAPIGGFSTYIRVGDVSLGHLAVAGFFCISGYLITQSSTRSTLGRYAVKRALRIFPGFWACLIVTGFGISLATGELVGGWDARSALGYVLSNVDMWGGEHQIGTTITGLPYPESWNGSLWTLRFEVLCYALIALALTIGFVKRNRVLIVVGFAVLTAGHLMAPSSTPQPILDFLFLAPFFLAGAILFLYSERIKVSGTIAGAAALFLFIAALTGQGETLGPLPVAYLCMWAGITISSKFHFIGRRHDISYGMYLYGFPVQHLLVAAGVAGAGQTLYSLVSVVATVPIAVASWFLVERPAIRMGQRR